MIKSLTSMAMLVFCAAFTCAQSKNQHQIKQIKWFFPGAHLSKGYQFTFPKKYEEITLATRDSAKLNAILFKAEKSKGIIFYLHGNTGALDRWGQISSTYTNYGYDLMMIDYRGYGKSSGQIESEQQLYSDMQLGYDYIKKQYPENKIIILGYSLGTGPAAWLAAHNQPKAVILQSPCYSLPDAIHVLKPSKDTSQLGLHFNIYSYLKATKSPVYILHGDQDHMFYYGSSLKLKKLFKPGDSLFTLRGSGHMAIESNPAYTSAISYILK